MIRGFDVEQGRLTRAMAEELKKDKILSAPAWSQFVKTGPANDRIPSQKDWWFSRGAGILRRFYVNHKPLGVNRLRVTYGDKTKNTYAGRHFKPAGGSIIREILQQLEAAQLIKKAKIGNHYGRLITPKGIAFVDKVAKSQR